MVRVQFEGIIDVEGMSIESKESGSFDYGNIAI